MVLKAKIVGGKIIPLDKNIGDKEGAIIEVEIIPQKKQFSWRGALNHIKKSSVELQHSIEKFE